MSDTQNTQTAFNDTVLKAMKEFVNGSLEIFLKDPDLNECQQNSSKMFVSYLNERIEKMMRENEDKTIA